MAGYGLGVMLECKPHSIHLAGGIARGQLKKFRTGTLSFIEGMLGSTIKSSGISRYVKDPQRGYISSARWRVSESKPRSRRHL